MKDRKSKQVQNIVYNFAHKCYDNYERKPQETKAQCDASCALLEIS